MSSEPTDKLSLADKIIAEQLRLAALYREQLRQQKAIRELESKIGEMLAQLAMGAKPSKESEHPHGS